MSIKTTYDIDRNTAIEIILSKIYKCKNEELANILEEFEESYYRNYFVHNKLPKEKYQFTIENINDF